jgi:hypothetical protein
VKGREGVVDSMGRDGGARGVEGDQQWRWKGMRVCEAISRKCSK